MRVKYVNNLLWIKYNNVSLKCENKFKFINARVIYYIFKWTIRLNRLWIRSTICSP